MPAVDTHGHDSDTALARWAGTRGGDGVGARRAQQALREPLDPARITIEIADPAAPTRAELDAARALCRRHNLCLYRTDPHAVDPGALSRLASALGLARRDHTLDADRDGVAAIHASPARVVEGFIPYSTRTLNWHTDGYYLAPPARIHAVLMHCARPAAHGGETELLDPEVVYLALLGIDPRLVQALSRPDAFTIPAREDAHGEARPAVCGPVFTTDPVSGAVHMRYTARTRSIDWSTAPEVREARDALRETIDRLQGGRLRIRLAAGEGVICNNVLHRRDAYTDADAAGAGRLLYRIRALDRVAGS